MARVCMVMAASLLLIGAWAGCGDGEDREVIAADVAREWVGSNTKLISDAAVELIVADKPALAHVIGAVVADQARDQLSWTYSVPRKLSEDRYMVVATTAAGVEVNLPTVGKKVYSVSVPFDLEIDTGTRTVLDWSVDFDSARLVER